jgi:hypothetical protein
MGILGDLLEEGGGYLGRLAGKGIGKLLPFRRGTKKVKPVLMKRGGKVGKRPTTKGPSMDAYMKRLRMMRK